MLNRRIIFGLALLLAVGCGSTRRDPLIGKWRVQDDKGERVVTFREDGTFIILSTFEYEGRTNSVEMSGTFERLPDTDELGMRQLVLKGSAVEYRGPDKDKLKKAASTDPNVVKYWFEKDALFIYTHPGYPPMRHIRLE